MEGILMLMMMMMMKNYEQDKKLKRKWNGIFSFVVDEKITY